MGLGPCASYSIICCIAAFTGIPDHYTLLGNYPPTPPLSQHFAPSEKLVLVLT